MQGGHYQHFAGKISPKGHDIGRPGAKGNDVYQPISYGKWDFPISFLGWISRLPSVSSCSSDKGFASRGGASEGIGKNSLDIMNNTQ
jgi:hypothetical protein